MGKSQKENMNIIAIIPARMASSRFPGKPMEPICGMPMIGHVYHRSRMCTSLSDVWVATCDLEIVNYIESIGGKAVMTADTHQRASDRAAEALLKIEKITSLSIDYAAMIQGDEPMLNPEMIDELVAPLRDDPGLQIANLIAKIDSQEESENANLVKVVIDQHGFALYFSREPIPSKKKYSDNVLRWKQLGLILFSRKALLDYTHMTPTPLEIIESVDMNRFLEHGMKIKTVPTAHRIFGVDVPADLQAVEPLLRQDPLTERYLVETGTR
jgi:3-deoxy-manno-octulosonate cytidylyltransferase (CMP-KDO synthetase)